MVICVLRDRNAGATPGMILVMMACQTRHQLRACLGILSAGGGGWAHQAGSGGASNDGIGPQLESGWAPTSLLDKLDFIRKLA